MIHTDVFYMRRVLTGRGGRQERRAASDAGIKCVAYMLHIIDERKKERERGWMGSGKEYCKDSSVQEMAFEQAQQ